MSELDDTLTQSFIVWYVCMVLAVANQGLMTSLMMSSRNNLCRNFGAEYLGNEARQRDGSNGQLIGTCLWAIDCACSRWRHVTAWRHNGDVIFFKCLFSGYSCQNWTKNTLTQCSAIWFVYMVLTDNRSGSDDVTDDVMTYNYCRNFGAKYLGNEAR